MKKFIWIVLICLISLSMNEISVNAQDPGWSTPIQLSPENESAWFPDLATDEYGGVHVVWSNSSRDYDNVIYTASQDGKTWSLPNDIIAFPYTTAAMRPRILSNNVTSKLYMTYRHDHIYIANGFISDAINAGSWSTERLSDVTQSAYFSELQFDKNGDLHVLMTWNTQSSTCLSCYHLFYRKLADGTNQWSEAKDISILNTGVAKPNLIIDREGNLHAVWEASDAGGGDLGAVLQPAYLMYAHSSDGGETWSEPVKFVPVQDDSRNPAIIQDQTGQILMTWLGLPENKVYYRVSQNGGGWWSASTAIPGLSGGWTIHNSLLGVASMAVDSDGLVHLVVIGQTNAVMDNLEVVHVTWDGENWSIPDVVATYAGDAPEWPRIAVSEGNILNVVWFLRDADHIWDTENGLYTIWYSRLETSAKTIPPKIRPTSTPTPVRTDRPTPIPTTITMATFLETITSTPNDTETAMPSVPENYVPGENAAYKEMDYLKIMAIAVIPAFLFIGLIVTIVVLRRSRHH